MPKISQSFQNLLRTTSHYPDALTPVALHGFLTAIVIGPEEVDDYSLLETVYGVNPTRETFGVLSNPVWEVLDEILETLLDYEFKPMLQEQTTDLPNPALWLQGFNKAVQLAEEAWCQLNDEHLEAGKKYAFIQTLAGPEQAELILGIPPAEYPTYVQEALPNLSNALEMLNQEYWGEQRGELVELDLEDLPSFTPQELGRQTDDELMSIILALGDMLPREVVDEAIRRGQPMASRLHGHLKTSHHWTNEAEGTDWWGLLHAIFILGYVSGEDATQGLAHAINRMDSEPDNDLWDWIAGYWPVLFRNKRAQAAQPLAAIATDRTLDWYPRCTAWECRLEAAQAAGPERLAEMLQQIAQSVADATEDWEYRLSLSQILLAFPRPDHRNLLETLAVEQQQKGLFPHYSLDEVDEAYREGKDSPEWEQFYDPLEFYEPNNILSRQLRWAQEDQQQWDDDEGLFEDSFEPLYDYEPTTPYFRETPKIGRNDPCPCGSGKKYKKCCLKKLH